MESKNAVSVVPPESFNALFKVIFDGRGYVPGNLTSPVIEKTFNFLPLVLSVSNFLINGWSSRDLSIKFFGKKYTTSNSFNRRFDSEIGSLPHNYNWLVGWYKEPEDGKPKILHYTEGGPWFDGYRDCEYSDDWKKEVINLFSA